MLYSTCSLVLTQLILSPFEMYTICMMYMYDSVELKDEEIGNVLN